MAKPIAGKGESLIDTQYLPIIKNESFALDENDNPIGVHGSSGLPGPLVKNEVEKTNRPKIT